MTPDFAAVTPYASIILPIIDRACTLEVAIPQACAQSRADIEVLITCSGATQEVLRVARNAAARDTRIRVLDLPASRVSTAQARAVALEEASSDRIFILQDDDIWLPDQVAVLGALLERADVAVGPTLALDLSGRGIAWLCNFAAPDNRAMLLAGASKMLFEAHYAFRRSAYRRCGNDWAGLAAGGCSRHVLRGFAAAGEGVRWAVTTRPTALSLNSPVRRYMSQPERAAEIARCLRGLEARGGAAGLLYEAAFTPVLETLLRERPAAVADDLADYLCGLGLALPESAQATEGLEVLPVTPDQAGDMARLFDLFQGRAVPQAELVPMIADLIAPFAGPEPRMFLTGSLLRDICGPRACLDLIDAAAERETDTYRKALLFLARATACLQDGHPSLAIAAWRTAEAIDPAATLPAALLGARIAAADGRTDLAARTLEAVIARGHGHAGHAQLLASLKGNDQLKL